MKNKKFIVRFLIQLSAIAVITALDQWFKVIAENKLPVGEIVKVIPGFIGLEYCRNTGAAFSMFDQNTNLLSIVTAIAIIAVLIYLALPKKRPLAYDIIIPAIVAGGIGNLIDRIARGYVIDYIKTLFMDFAIFNFADCFITCGCIAMVIYLIYETVAEAKKKSSGTPEQKAETND